MDKICCLTVFVQFLADPMLAMFCGCECEFLNLLCRFLLWLDWPEQRCESTHTMAAAAVHGRAFAKRMFSHGKENHVATPPEQAKLPTQMPSPTSRREISLKPKPTLPKSAEKITCVTDDLLRPSLVQGSDRALATRGYSFYNIVILG